MAFWNICLCCGFDDTDPIIETGTEKHKLALEHFWCDHNIRGCNHCFKCHKHCICPKPTYYPEFIKELAETLTSNDTAKIQDLTYRVVEFAERYRKAGYYE